MSNTITFDTHFHAKNLKKAGFNDDQIEAQLALAQAQTDFINNNLATKNDIDLVHKEIKNLENSLRKEISYLKWMLGIIILILIIPYITKLLGN